MKNSTLCQFRIDKQEKTETYAVLHELGVKPAQAMRLFFRQIRETQAIPFPIEHIPNEKTANILLQSDEEKDYKRFDTVEELFADLNN